MRNSSKIFKPIIVSFSGLDGSGKSTQIDKLHDQLNQNGISVTILWARGGYTPFFHFLKKMFRITLKSQTLKKESTLKKSQTKAMSNRYIAKLWLNIAISDLILYWAIYLRILRMMGKFVICDRFLDDTRLDFRRKFPSIPFEKMFLWRLLELVSPLPDVSILLWVPVDESRKRSLIKCEPFPDDVETLSWRLSSYLDEMIFPSEKYIILDGREDVNILAKRIAKSVTI
jgi:thymidylate kinase